MLGSQRALFAVVHANDPEFACLFGGWLRAEPPSRDPDDEWVMVTKRAEWVEVTPPAALDPRHTQQT